MESIYTRIAGIDEAGRGAWAGPVVAACVYFHKDVPEGLMDSKLLSPKKREELFHIIMAAGSVGVGIISSTIIDQVGIRQATFMAMQEALSLCTPDPDHVMIDGRDGFPFTCSHEFIVRGDSLKKQISAASIIAKVTRDRLMVELSTEYPGYDFGNHKGYGTKVHQQALRMYGVLPIHRKSYRPIQEHNIGSNENNTCL